MTPISITLLTTSARTLRPVDSTKVEGRSTMNCFGIVTFQSLSAESRKAGRLDF